MMPASGGRYIGVIVIGRISEDAAWKSLSRAYIQVFGYSHFGTAMNSFDIFYLSCGHFYSALSYIPPGWEFESNRNLCLCDVYPSAVCPRCK